MAGVGLLSFVVSACMGPPAPYEARMNYLRTVANRGAQTHQLLVSQEAPKIDSKRCQDAYAGLQDRSDQMPGDLDGDGGSSNEWVAQVQTFFVDSCVSGKPKPVPGTPQPAVPAAPPSSESPSSAPSPAPNSGGATNPPSAPAGG